MFNPSRREAIAARSVLGSTAVRQGSSVVEQSLFQDSLQFAAIPELTMPVTVYDKLRALSISLIAEVGHGA